jgi:hypothetical protein
MQPSTLSASLRHPSRSEVEKEMRKVGGALWKINFADWSKTSGGNLGIQPIPNPCTWKRKTQGKLGEEKLN